jgi:hypothetical protein
MGTADRSLIILILLFGIFIPYYKIYIFVKKNFTLSGVRALAAISPQVHPPSEPHGEPKKRMACPPSASAINA